MYIRKCLFLLLKSKRKRQRAMNSTPQYIIQKGSHHECYNTQHKISERRITNFECERKSIIVVVIIYAVRMKYESVSRIYEICSKKKKNL